MLKFVLLNFAISNLKNNAQTICKRSNYDIFVFASIFGRFSVVFRYVFAQNFCKVQNLTLCKIKTNLEKKTFEN